jgi:hypothetical protein
MVEKRLKIVLFLIIALMASSKVQPQTTNPRRAMLTPRQIAKQVLPSVVIIFATDSKGNNSLGSGFFVEPNVIATNYHVVENAAVISARLVMEKRNLKIIRIVGFDADKDLALLLVEGTKVRPLSLGNTSQLRIGDEIYVASNPEGWQGTFSEGIVGGFRRNGYIQITAPVSQGSSGGPVLNRWGEVIGIVVGSIREGQNLNFAIRASDLIALQRSVDETDDFPSLEEFARTENSRRVLPSEVPPVRPGVRSGLSVDEFLVCSGNEHYKGKRFSEAAKAYREAIRLNPSSAEAYYRLGNSYVKISRYGEAIVYYRSGIKLGSVYESIPSTIEAIQAYEESVALTPRSDVLNFILGEAYLKNGGNEKALSKYGVLKALKSGYANHLLRDISLHPNPENFDFSGVAELLSKCPK